MKHKTSCTPEEISMKAFFLGPRAENGDWFQRQVGELLSSWFVWRRELFQTDGSPIPAADLQSEVFLKRQKTFARRANELRQRFEQEIPKFSPRYVGHMFSELSLPALLGHLIALVHNPNNISAESSRVGLEVEKEAVQMLFAMLGSDPRQGVGHFTSGGTVANFEAITRARHRVFLWQAMGAFARRQGLSRMTLLQAAQMGWDEYERLNARIPKENFREYLMALKADDFYWEELEAVYEEHWFAPAILVGSSAHYSWKKGAALFGLPSSAVVECALDQEGRFDGESLREGLRRCEANHRPVAMVVSIAGTTEFGSVDRIDEIAEELRLQQVRGRSIWHHVDAAYGGFYTTLRKSPKDGPLTEPVLRSLGAVHKANSVTIDPHKLGYVPYASGVFLCQDRRDYPHLNVDAPYIDFNPQMDPGVYSLEGSRPATGAAATWLAGMTLGFDESGHGRILRRAATAKGRLMALLRQRADVHFPPGLDLNIVCLSLGSDPSLSALNRRSQEFMKWIEEQGESSFQVSRTTIARREGTEFVFRWLEERGIQTDTNEAFFVRLCLMNPFLTSAELRRDLIGELAAHIEKFLKV